jgi:hypothetical protein
MATPSWPATLPQCPLLNGFDEQPQPNVTAFKPEVGPIKARRRSTAKAWVTSMTFHFTNTQLDAFNTFFEATLEDGSLPFTMQHPRTTVIYNWIFDPANQPRIVRSAPRGSIVSFTLLRLP